MIIDKQIWRNWITELKEGIFDLLYPPVQVCPICNVEKQLRNGLGARCLAKVSRIYPPLCEKCGRPSRLEAVQNRYCTQCQETALYFSKARAVALYEGALREYLAELKYRFRPELGVALGELLVEWVKLNREFQKNDLIIPIPIHQQKLLVRGYNQAELLAKPLQRHLGIALKNDIMVRAKITDSQNSLNRSKRFSNIDSAFKVIDHQKVTGARILLIDDILTTGATASEAARILLKAGAVDVKVLTLAVGVMESEWLTT